jgi:hypothetical protein
VVLDKLLRAAADGRQQAGAAALIGYRPGETILAAVVVGEMLPAIAVLAFTTLIGIPLGFGILSFLIPVD